MSSEQHSSFADEVQRATEQLHVLNQCGDALYAPVAPCTSRKKNSEGDGHDPIYDRELYVTRFWKMGLIAVFMILS